MSSKRPGTTSAVIEEFDDDMDIPLPSHTLPNTGARGPLLEEIRSPGVGDDDDDYDEEDEEVGVAGAGPASRQAYQQFQQQASGKPIVTDVTPYKTWTCVYPIYIDAKRPYGRGQRRVERSKSVWWPMSKNIADAAHRLGLGTLHEVNKSHPRDWENPGRVRVQWKKEGKLVNPIIKTKKLLLEMICLQIHLLKPENVPKPPFNLNPDPKYIPPPTTAGSKSTATSATTSAVGAITSGSSTAANASSTSKGKQPASSGAGGKAATAQSSSKAKQAKPDSKGQPVFSKRRLPIPPSEEGDDADPPLSTKLSVYSPAVASGVLLDAVKAGMNPGMDGIPGLPGGPGGPGGAGAGGAGAGAGFGKGKRKIVRVRG